MDKVPLEILREIFNLSLSHEGEDDGGEEDEEDEVDENDEDEEDEEDENDEDEEDESDEDEKGELSQFSPYFTGPLTISHVCRYWRQAAISFGKLWTGLEIRYGHPKIKYDMIHTWIERTNGLPLDFSIFYAHKKVEDVEQRRTLESVTELLLAEQHRWRNVSFSWNFTAVSPEFRRIDITNMPMLRSLSLDINIRACDYSKLILPNVSLARSRLVEEVTFESGYPIEYGAEPLQYLTHGEQFFSIIDERGVTAAETCLDALMAGPSLEAFHAVYVGTFHEDDQPEILENRPHLVHDIEELVLDDNGGTFPELVISKVTLPKLRILNFKTGTSLRSESALPEFFRRSNPPLEKLELYGDGARHENLIPVLRDLPSLQTLTIQCCQNPESIFGGLSSTIDDDIICPRLLYLHLKEYGCSDDVPEPRRALDALCTLVELRADPTSPGRIRVNDDFVIPTSHIRREFEVMLKLLSIRRAEYNDLYIDFEGLDEL